MAANVTSNATAIKAPPPPPPNFRIGAFSSGDAFSPR